MDENEYPKYALDIGRKRVTIEDGPFVEFSTSKDAALAGILLKMFIRRMIRNETENVG